MRSTIFFSPLWLLAMRADVAQAYWRMACSVSQTARADPIRSPGGVSGHVHKFAGGINVNPSSTHDSLLGSSCSTCEVQDDKSAYWTPQLYYVHSNGTAQEVLNGGMTVYYVGRAGNASDPAVVLPSGFRMISGNSLLRSYDSKTLTYLNTRPVADRVSFRCIDEANDVEEQPYMFRTDCVDGLRAQINFPACWDGQNLYLDNSQHVAYLSGINNGVCPPTHPVPIPLLFFEVLYGTNDVDQSSGGQFVFSNGDTTGYGFHGDFVNGWNMDTFSNAIQNCLYTDNNGVATACPALASSHTYDSPRICPEAPSVFDEPVRGSLPGGLPGYNTITSGPAPATQDICPLNSSDTTAAISSNTLNSTTLSFNTSTATDSAPTTSTVNVGSFDTSTSTIFDSTISASTSFFTFNTIARQSVGGIFVTNGTAGTPLTSLTSYSISSDSLPSSSTTASPSLSDIPALSSSPSISTATNECSGFTTVYVTKMSFMSISYDSSTASTSIADITGSTTTMDAAIASTYFLSSSDVCSFYSDFSISGCPPPSTTEDVVTSTLVAETQLMTENPTSTTLFGVTGVRRLRIRGRAVV